MYFPLAFHICFHRLGRKQGSKTMLATLMTLGFTTAALFALATLGASLARGVAIAAALPRERTGSDFRMMTVRSASTSMTSFAARSVMRPGRRPVRQAFAPARSPQRVAA
jgi:hypothetical protein